MTDLLGNIALVVAHTPMWVWALYSVLLLMGLLRTRDSTVPLIRLLILPLVVTGLTASSVIGAGLVALPAMSAALALGAFGGLRFERADSARRIDGGRLWLRGEWRTLTQIVVVLVLRYVTNVVDVVYPALDANPVWHVGTLAALSALAGLFLGRTAVRLRLYFAARPARS